MRPTIIYGAPSKMSTNEVNVNATDGSANYNCIKLTQKKSYKVISGETNLQNKPQPIPEQKMSRKSLAKVIQALKLSKHKETQDILKRCSYAKATFKGPDRIMSKRYLQNQLQEIDKKEKFEQSIYIQKFRMSIILLNSNYIYHQYYIS